MTDTLTRDTPAGTVRALPCPQCGGTVALRAAGSTVSLICEHCGSTLDATTPDLALIARAAGRMRQPDIPLGTRGTLDGTAWEVVGYQERSDGELLWSEYLLFNPYEGYAFLVDDGRRFSLGRLLTAMPDVAGYDLRHGGRRFTRFGDTYEVRTQFVVGEFYWRARIGDPVDETDYVTPGTMLVCEENRSERTWTELTMLDRGVAERAFGLEPRTAGAFDTPAPHEPSPHRTALRDALMIAALALAAVLVIGIGTAGAQRVLERRISVPLDERTHTAVLGPITASAPRQKVHIASEAGDLDNQWIDLDYSLVERRTQESFDASATAERYHGRDSDGDWTEGDRSPNTGLASIPRGTYDLVVEATAHRWTDPRAASTVGGIWGSTAPASDAAATLPVTITVDRGGGFFGLFLLALIAIGIWPAIVWFNHAHWESRRTAPLRSADGDDE